MPRYIDAESLKETVNSRSSHWLNDWSTLGVLAAIDEQPTADVAPVVHAHWITCNYLENNMLLDENEFYKCSACFHKVIRKTDYCSKCGAKMNGKENEK